MKPYTSRESVDCVVVPDFDAACAHGKGAIYFVEENGEVVSIGMVLPCDAPPIRDMVCPRELPVALVKETHKWEWDGNKECPTMTPSILTSITWGPERQRIELWHGFLTSGRLVSC